MIEIRRGFDQWKAVSEEEAREFVRTAYNRVSNKKDIERALNRRLKGTTFRMLMEGEL